MRLSIALLGKVRTSASCARARSVHLYHLKAQRQAPATTRQSGVRLWLPVKKKRKCQMKQRLDIISKQLFLSPAKTIFKHKVESGVTTPGASANEQANIRLTVRHGGHAGVAGWREDEPIIPDTPSWATYAESP